MRGLHVEVVLGSAYALFLMLAAIVLEGMAQQAHRRAKHYHQRGFTYHPGFDLWECPNGERLTRHSTDPVRRVTRYRAAAVKCNNCALKANCTDSDAGREIVQSTESWLDSEIGRFHRGISLALLILSALIVLVVGARHHNVGEAALLSIVFGGIVVLGYAFARVFHPKRAARPAKELTGLISLSPWDGEAAKAVNRQQPFS